MNLLDKGKVLIVLIMLSVLYSSCEEDFNTIGIPADNNLSVNYFEYDIPVEMLWVDSVVSQNIGVIYSGKFDLDEVGVIKAIPFISYGAELYDSNINVPHNAVYKDIYLNLDYRTALSGDENVPITLNVFQLEDTIEMNRNVVKFIEDSSPLGSLVGQKTFTFFPDTLNAKLTSDTVEYSERIDLDNELGQFYMTKLKQRDPSVFFDFETFDASFKGLAIVPSDGNTALLGFTPGTASSVVIEYTFLDEEGVEKEGKFTFRPIRYYHNITPNKDDSDLSGTEFPSLPCCYEPFTPEGEFYYQMFGTGINLSLDLSGFKNFTDSLNSTIVNGASIVIDDVMPTSPYQNPPNALGFYFIDETGHRMKKEFANTTFFRTLPINELHLDPLRVAFPASAPYNQADEQYSVNITLYMQKLIEDESTPARLIIENADMPNYGNSTLQFLRRSSKALTGIKVPKNSIKVKIYYSTVN
ncbi:MAG: hypothetical protein ACNS60_14160 [Candidatus Cyclobacteriaceae bacterium M2_1C_046]